ncbi:hypothetical protein [Aliivibrio fischeri]|uniref:hypothetical protein n=1 Tax=Aliivibrio fischeri TaxID=668 RepID=UPI0007C58AB6|nr:hypothetical protein [Aliivibrio fischeri]
MAIIRRGSFGGYTLTGIDAKAFAQQIQQAKPNERAKDALTKGRKRLKEMKHIQEQIVLNRKN